jgi:hypothetical protein
MPWPESSAGAARNGFSLGVTVISFVRASTEDKTTWIVPV